MSVSFSSYTHSSMSALDELYLPISVWVPHELLTILAPDALKNGKYSPKRFTCMMLTPLLPWLMSAKASLAPGATPFHADVGEPAGPDPTAEPHTCVPCPFSVAEPSEACQMDLTFREGQLRANS